MHVTWKITSGKRGNRGNHYFSHKPWRTTDMFDLEKAREGETDMDGDMGYLQLVNTEKKLKLKIQSARPQNLYLPFESTFIYLTNMS